MFQVPVDNSGQFPGRRAAERMHRAVYFVLPGPAAATVSARERPEIIDSVDLISEYQELIKVCKYSHRGAQRAHVNGILVVGTITVHGDNPKNPGQSVDNSGDKRSENMDGSIV